MPSGDAFKKTLDALEKYMLPHRGEERDKTAEKIKKLLISEAGKTLKIKVVGDGGRRGKSKGQQRKR